MSAGVLPVMVREEELWLHPERAVFWPRLKTLIVADTHFGKSGFFGRHGIPVPSGCDEEDRTRLSRLVKELMAERLLILGDFLHAPIAADSKEALDLVDWARDLAPVRIVVIPGNHDRGAAGLAAIGWHGSELREPPFRFVHEASRSSGPDGLFSLSGHIHPVMVLAPRRQRLRVPVFWQRTAGLVLPSFGAFTGGFVVRAAPGERLFAVGPHAVTQLPVGV